MSLPLMITDESGSVLYTDRSVKISGALHLFASAAAKNDKKRIVYYKGKSIFVKEVSLGGKRFLFFMDTKNLCDCLGMKIDVSNDTLFELPKAFGEKKPFSLNGLVQIFATLYSKELFENGVRMSVHSACNEQVVNVSPAAFALCLALMVRLLASEGAVVKLSLATECARPIIYADSTGGSPLDKTATELLKTLLYEIAATAEFAVEERIQNGKHSFSLSLLPLDISLLGLKVATFDTYKKFVKLYIKMFL